MYKNILQAVDGIKIYPIISFLIFFIFFIGLTLFVLLSKKSHIKTMSEMPLQNENLPSTATPEEKKI